MGARILKSGEENREIAAGKQIRGRERGRGGVKIRVHSCPSVVKNGFRVFCVFRGLILVLRLAFRIPTDFQQSSGLPAFEVSPGYLFLKVK
jgi:hypothetical protein